MKKINQIKKNVIILKKVAVFVSLLVASFSSYVVYEKYDEMKFEFSVSVFNSLEDKYFCCDYWGDVKDQIRQTVEDHYYNEKIDEKVIDAIIRRDLKSLEKSDTLLIVNYWRYSWKDMDRSEIEDLVIQYRIEEEQNIEIDKQKSIEDSISNERYDIINKEVEKQIANKNFFSYFPVAYIIGIVIGTSIIPFIFWFLWYYEKYKLKKVIENEKIKKRELILAHPKYGSEFNNKIESLIELKNSQILKIDEFNQKLEILVNEYGKIIQNEIENSKNEEIKIKLQNAYELGNISEDELNEKLNSYGIYDRKSTKFNLDMSICAVCKSKLTPNDKVCKECGLQITQ